MTTDPLITQEKFFELEQTLAQLQASRPHAAAEVARLAELGDFSENVEYQMAKGRLRGINQGIEDTENQLKRAEIILPAADARVVAVGHMVTVLVGGAQKTYHILGSAETNPAAGVISYTSPLGAALLGHAVRDVVKIKFADRETEYKIIEIK